MNEISTNQTSMKQGREKQDPRAQRSLMAVLGFAVLTIVLAGTAIPVQAQSCTDSWTGGGGDGAWSDGLNWSTGVEPGSSDNVCIQGSGAAVSLDVSDGIADLTLGSSD